MQLQESCAQPCSVGYASFANLVRTRVWHLMALHGHLVSIRWRRVRGNRAYEKHLTPQHGNAASAESRRVIEPGLGNYLATFKSSSGKKKRCTMLNGSSDALSVNIGLTPDMHGVHTKGLLLLFFPAKSTSPAQRIYAGHYRSDHYCNP